MQSQQSLFAAMRSWRRNVCIAAGLVIATMVGCQGKQYEPVDRALAEQVQTPSALVDVERDLGPAHPPSRAQQASIQETTVQRMPEAIRKNAEADRTLAWGNDEGFLVVKVNAEGTIWVASRQFGGPRPKGMKPPPIPPAPVFLAPSPMNASP